MGQCLSDHGQNSRPVRVWQLLRRIRRFGGNGESSQPEDVQILDRAYAHLIHLIHVPI